MNKNISFIIPCFNCETTLSDCIDSIFKGNFFEGDEIILVDDCSTDGTQNVIFQLKKKYNKIISIKHNINKGSAAASRNSAIDISQNDLLFCLDADNMLMPQTVPLLRKFLIENHLDAAAFGEIYYFKKDTHNLSATWYFNSSLNFIDALNYPQKTPCGSGNYLFSRDIWKKAGRFNESVGGALDSEVFGLSILGVGAKFKTLKGYGYFHRHGYQSTFIKEINKYNTSLILLTGIIRYLHLIDSKSIDYMFGSGRTNWWYNTFKRPIKAASGKEQVLKMKLKRRFSAVLERI